ncbi:MAG: hypothetical protein IK092_07385 [Muribaculaceae bacterium]|nr:hypothetical protein [Muribaculaceae bacterium]
MDYKDIQKKYEKEVGERKTSISAAKARIEFLKQLRQNCIETRELYRSDGTPNAERSQNWNRMTRNISRLDAKIRDAEIELGRVCLGNAGVEQLIKSIT